MIQPPFVCKHLHHLNEVIDAMTRLSAGTLVPVSSCLAGMLPQYLVYLGYTDWTENGNRSSQKVLNFALDQIFHDAAELHYSPKKLFLYVRQKASNFVGPLQANDDLPCTFLNLLRAYMTDLIVSRGGSMPDPIVIWLVSAT